MRLLLDTHVVIAASRRQLPTAFPEFAGLFDDPANRFVISVASLWEIAIKVRIGKLTTEVEPSGLAPLLRSFEMTTLAIQEDHATARLDPDPPTRDPFDRMLLAQCAVEGMRLVTVDRALAAHPLAWRPG